MSLRPIPRDALHVAVDVQRLFTEHSEWRVPSLPAILPNLLKLCRHRPQQTLFTRFIPPASAEHGAGAWRRFYERWSSVTLDRMAPAMVELVPELAALAPPVEVIDKGTYSAFGSEAFRAALARRHCGTLILSGIETDVCVLASMFEAVDRGLRCVVAGDAVTSGSARCHAAALEIIATRFSEQVDVAPTAEIIAAWGC
jgi:nicotinamidase-related amidase